jgi:hypothetical protein
MKKFFIEIKLFIRYDDFFGRVEHFLIEIEIIRLIKFNIIPVYKNPLKIGRIFEEELIFLNVKIMTKENIIRTKLKNVFTIFIFDDLSKVLE